MKEIAKLKKQVNLLLNEGTPISVDQAKKILIAQAEKSDIAAQLLLIEFILEYELDHIQDALEWMSRAAELGSGKAAYYLSRLYSERDYYPLDELKKFVSIDKKKSQAWLERAAKYSYFQAQWDMAQLAFDIEDYDQALNYIQLIKRTKKSDFYDEEESVQEIKVLAQELEEKIEDAKKKTKIIESMPDDLESLKPEQIYNNALLILDSDKNKARELLKRAADAGLVAARKKLAELK